METVVFLGQKGGAGKSTIATNIAVAAALDGERIAVFDMDPARTLLKWRAARSGAAISIDHVVCGDLPDALRHARKNGATLTLIDTPGTASGPLLEAARLADLCVIPVRPNAFDIWASEETVLLLREHQADFTFLLNQCPPVQQKNRVRQSLNALEATGGIIGPMVCSRVDYQDAARLGLGVMEHRPKGAAAAEMAELWRSLAKRLKRRPQIVEPAIGDAETFAAPLPNPYFGIFDEALNVGRLYTSFIRVLLAESERFSGGAENDRNSNDPEYSVRTSRRRTAHLP